MINGNDRIQALSINTKLLLLMAVTESLPESVFGKASGLH